MTDLKKEKAELRKKMLALRAKIPVEKRIESNRALFQKMTSLTEYEAAQTIFIYVSVDDEPDTHALIEDAWKRKKRVCVPLCESLGVMHAVEIRSKNDLQAGKYNIPEPKDGCTRVPQNKIDLNIVPCVCWSQDGYRLGYGGGFYDSWIKDSHAPSALFCFDKMRVPSVPHDEHDQKIDIVVCG